MAKRDMDGYCKDPNPPKDSRGGMRAAGGGPVPLLTGHDYDEDFYAWALDSAILLRAKRFSDIDTARLAEEIEDMGKRERRALRVMYET